MNVVQNNLALLITHSAHGQGADGQPYPVPREIREWTAGPPGVGLGDRLSSGLMRGFSPGARVDPFVTCTCREPAAVPAARCGPLGAAGLRRRLVAQICKHFSTI